VFGLGRRRSEPASSEKLRCSFCNKSQDDVRKLIAGPKVFICDECVDVCIDILADADKTSGAGALCLVCRHVVPLVELVTLEGGAQLRRGCVTAIKSSHVQGVG
jgi:hypothetical protein